MRPLAPDSRPRLPRGVRMRFDPVRAAWVVLAPERVLFPDAIAQRVLARCDGETSIDGIARALGAEFAGPIDAVRNDVLELLQDLADRGLLDA